MKANELRIGNWVTDEFWDSFKTHIKVESINHKGINLIIQDDGNYPECAQSWIEPVYFFDQLKGIPLTPEILQKCGFVEVSSWTYEYPLKGNLRLFYYIGERGWCIGLKQYADFRCEYLHELQNAIYALTGEELNYQP